MPSTLSASFIYARRLLSRGGCPQIAGRREDFRSRSRVAADGFLPPFRAADPHGCRARLDTYSVSVKRRTKWVLQHPFLISQIFIPVPGRAHCVSAAARARGNRQAPGARIHHDQRAWKSNLSPIARWAQADDVFLRKLYATSGFCPTVSRKCVPLHFFSFFTGMIPYFRLVLDTRSLFCVASGGNDGTCAALRRPQALSSYDKTRCLLSYLETRMMIYMYVNSLNN
jgi:hypothetical protein